MRLVLLIVFSLVGQSGDDDEKLAKLFAGMVFVADSKMDEMVPDHGNDQKPMPQKFEPDSRYVFHNVGVKIRDMKGRLRKLGFKIIHEPRTSQDLIFLMIGGPLFDFKVEQPGRQIFIFFKNCPACMRGDSAGPCNKEVVVRIAKK